MLCAGKVKVVDRLSICRTISPEMDGGGFRLPIQVEDIGILKTVPSTSSTRPSLWFPAELPNQSISISLQLIAWKRLPSTSKAPSRAVRLGIGLRCA
jgi:hypothetical protein